MARLLLAFAFAASVACVASYQQSVRWGGFNNGPFGNGGSGNYGNGGYGISDGFVGGLGGLSVYPGEEQNNGGNFEFAGSYPWSQRFPSPQGGLGNAFGSGWLGQQQMQQQQQQHFDW